MLAGGHRSEMGFDGICGGTTSATQVQVDRINGFMGITEVGGRQLGNHYILH